jgi:GH18 family chitinase
MLLKSCKPPLRGFSIESLESRTMLTLAGQVVGYIPDYEYSNFSKIDLSAVTHLNYFSVVASSTGTLGTTSKDGYNFSQMEAVVNAAHAASPRVSVSITVDPISAFQTIANSSSVTNTFITNILNFCTTYSLDGIDLDYEPGAGTLTTAQKNSWGGFLATLHAQTSADHLTLSEAVQAVQPGQMIIPKADISDLDWYYLMTYDLESYSSAPYSDTLSYLANWVNYGVPKSQLVVGVPFYGRSGATWGVSQTMTYSAILTAYAAQNGGALPGPTVDSITLSNNTIPPSSSTWGFNSISDMQQKAQYILQNGYGGMMIWELGQDHFSGSGYDQYSLLPAIKAEFNLPITASAGAVYSATTTALNITSGTLTITGNVSSIDANLAVTVSAGATLIVSAPGDLASLNIAGGKVSVTPGTGLVVFGSLTISSGGLLDLNNNTMIAQGTSSATVFNQLKAGFNASQGYWNGTMGIISTAAYNDTTTLTTLGYLPGGAPFDGVNTTSNDTIVKYTYYGDANLDGVVNGADYQQIDSGFGAHATGWSNGDFNYGGVVDGSDFSLIDNAYNQNLASGANPLALVAASPVAKNSTQATALPQTIGSDSSSWLADSKKHKARNAFFLDSETAIESFH